MDLSPKEKSKETPAESRCHSYAMCKLPVGKGSKMTMKAKMKNKSYQGAHQSGCMCQCECDMMFKGSTP